MPGTTTTTTTKERHISPKVGLNPLERGLSKAVNSAMQVQDLEIKTHSHAGIQGEAVKWTEPFSCANEKYLLQQALHSLTARFANQEVALRIGEPVVTMGWTGREFCRACKIGSLDE